MDWPDWTLSLFFLSVFIPSKPSEPRRLLSVVKLRSMCHQQSHQPIKVQLSKVFWLSCQRLIWNLPYYFSTVVVVDTVIDISQQFISKYQNIIKEMLISVSCSCWPSTCMFCANKNMFVLRVRQRWWGDGLPQLVPLTQLRTRNGLHRVTETWQQKIEKCFLFWYVLISAATFIW